MRNQPNNRKIFSKMYNMANKNYYRCNIKKIITRNVVLI